MKPMKVLIVLFALLMSGIWGGMSFPAAAADLKPVQTRSHVLLAPRGDTLPFPRSERAQSVWASNICWSDCGSTCAWGLAHCLAVDAQGTCLKLTDRCDRSCQRQCRTSGGPLLPIEFAWE
jgi:hypothetical protein